MKDIFAPGGLIARHHPDYEYRPGQIAMAEAVEEALRGRRHLLVEAGTGTGKTLAYLVPAVAAGQRIIVSTEQRTCRSNSFRRTYHFSSGRFLEIQGLLSKGGRTISASIAWVVPTRYHIPSGSRRWITLMSSVGDGRRDEHGRPREHAELPRTSPSGGTSMHGQTSASARSVRASIPVS
jgi:hypothetical protein